LLCQSRCQTETNCKKCKIKSRQVKWYFVCSTTELILSYIPKAIRHVNLLSRKSQSHFKLPILRANKKQRMKISPNMDIKTVSKWMSLYKSPLYDLFWPFFAIFMFIFHKTEVLTVILRCLTGLTYYWFKSYDTKRKYFYFFFFCHFLQKQTFASFAFFAFLCFCLNFFTN
jgi:hypothetical protein